MKVKFSKKTTFVCQITDETLKVAKCQLRRDGSLAVDSLEVEELLSKAQTPLLAESLSRNLKKLGYKNEPLVISLPRSQVTCRFIKIPSNSTSEIERIVNFQASRYLPYPLEELVSGYQVVGSDAGGYSHVNLIIVQKQTINKYLEMVKDIKPVKITIAIDSYGLINLYNYIYPAAQDMVMLMEIDLNQISLAVVSGERIVFSRSFNLNRKDPNYDALLAEEFNKTRDAYLKETTRQAPAKVLIFGQSKNLPHYAGVLGKQTNLQAQTVAWPEKVYLSRDLRKGIFDSEISFASLIGFGIRGVPESLNLLPQDIKKESDKLWQARQIWQTAIFVFLIIGFLVIGMAKNYDNKVKYLAFLKGQINNVSKDARPLEEIENRFKSFRVQSEEKPTNLDVLDEVFKIFPPELKIVSLSLENQKELILRGQSPELSSVFNFVTGLQKSPVLKNFDVKVRYATKKITGSGEVIEFEIACAKAK